MTQIINLQAETLLTLVKEHKQSCDGKCGMSLFILYSLFESLVGGKKAKKNFKYFM